MCVCYSKRICRDYWITFVARRRDGNRSWRWGTPNYSTSVPHSRPTWMPSFELWTASSAWRRRSRSRSQPTGNSSNQKKAGSHKHSHTYTYLIWLRISWLYMIWNDLKLLLPCAQVYDCKLWVNNVIRITIIPFDTPFLYYVFVRLSIKQMISIYSAFSLASDLLLLNV